MLNNVACHLRYALIVIMVVILIICLSRWTGKTSVTYGRPEQVVAKAVADNQAARSKTNRLEALLDVTAALATLQTVTFLAGPAAVNHAVGKSVQEVEEQLMDHQHQIMMDLHPRKTSLKPLPKI